ncbi:MAG: hypothetical protein AB4911_25410 [Oscillochloridaceae bacterium umkhey_bin13]
MNSFNALADAIQRYIDLVEAKRRNRVLIERARTALDQALTAHRAALVAPAPVSNSTDPGAVACPVCGHQHDCSPYVTGCSVYCVRCSAWLLVSHQAGETRLMHVG